MPTNTKRKLQMVFENDDQPYSYLHKVYTPLKCRNPLQKLQKRSKFGSYEQPIEEVFGKYRDEKRAVM
jgi:hypothetical protein